MINTAIIAEYNPFHLGHKFHIQEARAKTNADFITVILSGSFVQRAEPAMFSKEARVKMALLAGADLVIELPAVNVLQSAERYALGAVSVANAINADYLCFGSECGDISLLEQAADILLSGKLKDALSSNLQKGLSFPVAREKAVEELNPQLSQILRSSNNILGVEYVKAIKNLSSNIKPVTVKRVGTDHDSPVIESCYASASKIRELLKENKDISALVPEEVLPVIYEETKKGACFIDKSYYERALLSHIRNVKAADIEKATDCKEGIEYRIKSALQKGININDVLMSAKSKRYTHSRLRRIIASSFLGINKDMFYQAPYIRLLGMKKQAACLWGQIKENINTPVIEKAAKAMESLDNEARAIFEKEIEISEVWNSFSGEIQPFGAEYRKFPVVL